MSEARIKVAAKLYETRDAMRRLFATSYAEKIATFREFIEAEIAAKKCSELEAAMNIVGDLQRDVPDSGMSQALILAACVEMIEPSI